MFLFITILSYIFLPDAQFPICRPPPLEHCSCVRHTPCSVPIWHGPFLKRTTLNRDMNRAFLPGSATGLTSGLPRAVWASRKVARTSILGLGAFIANKEMVKKMCLFDGWKKKEEDIPPEAQVGWLFGVEGRRGKGRLISGRGYFWKLPFLGVISSHSLAQTPAPAW